MGVTSALVFANLGAATRWALALLDFLFRFEIWRNELRETLMVFIMGCFFWSDGPASMFDCGIYIYIYLVTDVTFLF